MCFQSPRTQSPDEMTFFGMCHGIPDKVSGFFIGSLAFLQLPMRQSMVLILAVFFTSSCV